MSKLLKNRPLRQFTKEEDLENMKKNRDKFLKKIGNKKYEILVKKLEDFIKNEKK